ncbi:MAG TPA: FadR/GntR family transcriptional regulator [Smithella sp.]|nr:FadR/GntR family transcriptional regulator [Smithella sp.]
MKKVMISRPLTRSRLHEEIVSMIQKQIINGDIAPGSKLPPEREMAQSFSVNRATVREALRKLENLELVEIRHGDGLYVKNYLESGNFDLIKSALNSNVGEKTLYDILETRRYVVPQIAYLAALRRTEADLADLAQTVFHQETDMLSRDIRVHQLIARAAQNLVCTITLNFFNQIFREYGHLYFDDEKNAERSALFHREIYEAIKKQNAQEARRIMLDVLIYAEEAVKASLAKADKRS